MDLQKEVENLQNVVAETSGTALTISPKEGKWSGYLLQQKLSFEADSLGDLCKHISSHIVEKRIANSQEGKGKRKIKPFKYK